MISSSTIHNCVGKNVFLEWEGTGSNYSIQIVNIFDEELDNFSVESSSLYYDFNKLTNLPNNLAVCKIASENSPESSSNVGVKFNSGYWIPTDTAVNSAIEALELAFHLEAYNYNYEYKRKADRFYDKAVQESSKSIYKELKANFLVRNQLD